jgi:hypothetical protein
MQEEQQTNEKEEKYVEERDLDKPDYIFVPKGNHGWLQQGPYLVCRTCDLTHATFIGVSRTLTGIDKDGQPILKKLMVQA